ncbi:HET-domain-containing protein, partial [Melanomma pulvis-pyrius CBS 109.77]
MTNQGWFSFQTKLTYWKNGFNLIKVGPWQDATVDFGLVRKWVQTCKEDHPESVCGTPNIPLREDAEREFRLIDIEKMCVVLAPSTEEYAALSYVWGKSGAKLELVKSNQSAIETEGSLLEHHLPETISDAMSVCKELGINYLWVDALCIVQDAAEIKLSQITSMDKIYSNASLTIIALAATSGASGLVGTANRPRQEWLFSPREYLPQMHETKSSLPNELLAAVWNTRGWTYQERILSRRCLYFGQSSVYFQCRQVLSWKETHLQYPKGIRDLFVSYGRWGPSKGEEFTKYCECVESYTRRELTQKSDMINAFTGASEALSSTFKTTFFLGLPEKFFHSALVWYFNHNEQRPQSGERTDFPSWSWAGSLG